MERDFHNANRAVVLDGTRIAFAAWKTKMSVERQREADLSPRAS